MKKIKLLTIRIMYKKVRILAQIGILAKKRIFPAHNTNVNKIMKISQGYIVYIVAPVIDLVFLAWIEICSVMTTKSSVWAAIH